MIIVAFTGDGSSNTMTYIIACVYAGVAVIVIIVVFTGDGSSNTMTYNISPVFAGVAVIVIILYLQVMVTETR